MLVQKHNATLPEFEEYAKKHTSSESDILYRLYRETHLKTIYPRMLSGNFQGQLLRMLSTILKPKVILEIGTFTGYSTINLALGLSQDGLIHTIDSNPESVEIGRRYFKEAGLGNKIITHIGNAKEIIPTIQSNFDLVFIDADKENYLAYYHLIFNNLNSGGVILADNAFWDGKVLNENASDTETRGIIEFNKYIQHDERVENILIPLRDGLMMIRKK